MLVCRAVVDRTWGSIRGLLQRYHPWLIGNVSFIGVVLEVVKFDIHIEFDLQLLSFHFSVLWRGH